MSTPHYFQWNLLTSGKTIRVPQGYQARIVCGVINHVTGTNTSLSLFDKDQKFTLTSIAFIATGTASGTFYLNDKITTGYGHIIDLNNLWIGENQLIGFTAAATAKIILQLEFKPMEENN